MARLCLPSAPESSLAHHYTQSRSIGLKMISEAPRERRGPPSFLLGADHSGLHKMTLLIIEQTLYTPTLGPVYLLFLLCKISTWLPLIVPSSLFSALTISVRSFLNTLFNIVSFFLTPECSHLPGLCLFPTAHSMI